MSAPRAAPRQAAAVIVLMSSAVLLLALGAWWASDRGQRWQTPSWAASEFVDVVPPAGAATVTELRVVPINPRCPHCRGHLARAVAECRGRVDLRVAALIVDTPKPPAVTTCSSAGVDGWWWDAHDTWRRRWGHRIYGEVMVFDRQGRYHGTLPPRPAP